MKNRNRKAKARATAWATKPVPDTATTTEPAEPIHYSTLADANAALSAHSKVVNMKEAQMKSEAKKAATKAAKPRRDLPSLPALPKTRSRKEKPLKPCECGCGGQTKSKYAPGHDSYMRGAALRVERGLMTLDDFESLLVKSGKDRKIAKAQREAVEGEIQRRKAEARAEKRAAKTVEKKSEAADEATGTEGKE